MLSGLLAVYSTLLSFVCTVVGHVVACMYSYTVRGLYASTGQSMDLCVPCMGANHLEAEKCHSGLGMLENTVVVKC